MPVDITVDALEENICEVLSLTGVNISSKLFTPFSLN